MDEELSAPYTADLDDNLKFTILHKSLTRSIWLKSRIMALINAYFLGKFLNDLDTTLDHYRYR